MRRLMLISSALLSELHPAISDRNTNAEMWLRSLAHLSDYLWDGLGMFCEMLPSRRTSGRNSDKIVRVQVHLRSILRLQLGEELLLCPQHTAHHYTLDEGRRPTHHTSNQILDFRQACQVCAGEQ